MQTNYGKAARLLFQLPRDCRVFTVLAPPVQWGWNEILQNKMAYLLEVLVWQNSKDAQKKAPQHKPKPFTPEFMKPKQTNRPTAKGVMKADVDTIKDILSRPRN